MHPLQQSLREAIKKRDAQVERIRQLEHRRFELDAAFQLARQAEVDGETRVKELTEAFVSGDVEQTVLDAARAGQPTLADASEQADELLRAINAQVDKAEVELQQRNIVIAALATPLAKIACAQSEAQAKTHLRAFAGCMAQRHAIALGAKTWASEAASAAAGHRVMVEPVSVSSPSSGMLRAPDAHGHLDDGLLGLLRSQGLTETFCPVAGANGVPPEVLMSMAIAYEPPPDEAA